MTTLASSFLQSDSGLEKSFGRSSNDSRFHDNSSREYGLFGNDAFLRDNSRDYDLFGGDYVQSYPRSGHQSFGSTLDEKDLPFLDLSFVNYPPPPQAQNRSRHVGPLHTLSADTSKDSVCEFRSALITSPPQIKLPPPGAIGTGRLVRTHSFSPAPPDLTFDKRGTSPLQGLLSVGGAPSQTLTIMQMSDVKDNPLVRGLIGGPANVNSGNNLTKAKQWTHRELVTTVLKDVTITVEWLKDRGLMPNTRTCSRCGPLVRLELSRAQRTRHWQTYDQLVWLCHNCDQSIYLRQGTFFDRPFNVSLITYVEMMYWWSRCMPVEQIAEQTRTRQSFVTLMICLLREVCAFEIGECALIKGGIGAEVHLLKNGQFTLNGLSCDDYMPTLEPAEATWRLKFGFNAFECILRHICDMYRS